MTTPHGQTPQELAGLNVVDADGHRVGPVQQVYSDDGSGVPEWITVRTGLFGTKETFVPLAGARTVDNDLRVPYAKDEIKTAPRIDADGHLEPEQEGDLYRHYGLTEPESQPGTPSGTRQSGARPGPGGADGYPAGAGPEEPPVAPGPVATPGRRWGSDRSEEEHHRAVHDGRTRENASPVTSTRGNEPGEDSGEKTEEMILSEERLHLGTEEHETGRARLRKHVVAEDVTGSVPVSHEEARISREPITEEDRRAGRTAPRIEDGQVEVVLHEERPHVNKDTVPVERVRLNVERVTEQREVTTEVHREEAEYDDGTGHEGGTHRDRDE